MVFIFDARSRIPLSPLVFLVSLYQTPAKVSLAHTSSMPNLLPPAILIIASTVRYYSPPEILSTSSGFEWPPPTRVDASSHTIACPLNAPAWEAALYDHPDRDLVGFITHSIRYGVNIVYSGPRTVSRTIPNSVAIKSVVDRVRQDIAGEIAAGRVAGPFSSAPFAFFICSPLICVDKPGGGTRICHNLSSPFGDSVNDWVLPIPCKLTAFDSFCELVAKLGAGAFLFKRKKRKKEIY